MKERFSGTSTKAFPEEQLNESTRRRRTEPLLVSGTSDVEFLFPWGWGELEGVANRADYDLLQHAEHSGQKLEYFEAKGPASNMCPLRLEPAAGATIRDGVSNGRLRRRTSE